MLVKSSEYLHLLETENLIRLLEPLKTVKEHHLMQCLVCHHKWTATPISKRQTFKKHGVGGCPQCNVARRQVAHSSTRTRNLRKLADRGIQVLSKWYDGRHTFDKVQVKNLHCGHTFLCSANNLLQAEVECSICGPQKRVAPLTAWSKANSSKWKETASDWQKYKTEVAAETALTYSKYKHRINPNNYPRGRAGEVGAYHLDHIVPKRFCFDNNIPAKVCADVTNLQMISWRDNVGSRNHVKGTIPALFFNYIPSKTKMREHIQKLKLIFPEGKEFVNLADVIVTLYDAATNQAVLVIPLDKSHANLKSAWCAYKTLTAVGIKIIILFEDELNDVSLITSKLTHYAHNSSVSSIHARQCEVRLCTNLEKKALLDANHVQGNDISHVAYGAYYNNLLVAVMTFAKPRVALGQKGNVDRTGMWELSRFCTDVNHRIPGIASKLLTHFKRNHAWKQIYSYADKRWSTGNMYYKLGFELMANNPPDYFYVINGERKHRWNYRKDILKNTLENYDPTATEYQNMVDHGYWRVWDCGTLKFSITNKSE